MMRPIIFSNIQAGDLAQTAISLTVLSVNYLGDGLRDALDPRLRSL